MRCVHSWGAHELEGWSVAFDRAEPSTLYSGGDDAILKRWDLRTASGDDGDCVATTLNRRSHGAGVCCISPHALYKTPANKFCPTRPLVKIFYYY